MPTIIVILQLAHFDTHTYECTNSHKHIHHMVIAQARPHNALHLCSVPHMHRDQEGLKLVKHVCVRVHVACVRACMHVCVHV